MYLFAWHAETSSQLCSRSLNAEPLRQAVSKTMAIFRCRRSARTPDVIPMTTETRSILVQVVMASDIWNTTGGYARRSDREKFKSALQLIRVKGLECYLHGFHQCALSARRCTLARFFFPNIQTPRIEAREVDAAGESRAFNSHLFSSVHPLSLSTSSFQ